MTEEIKDPEGLLKAYNKAKEDLVSLRAELKQLQEGAGNVTDEVQKWKKMALEATAASALGSDSKRLLKYIDLAGVEMDEEGNLKGMDEKINSLKEDFPELFDAKRKAGKSNADIHENNASKVERSATDIQLDALFK